MLGARDGMRRHEMHAGRQMRRHVPHHGALDRADVGDNSAWLEMISDFLRDRAAGADRDAQDDQIGVISGFRIGLHHRIDNAELLYPRAGLRRARGGDDFPHEPLFARGTCDRAADQPEADQRDLFEWRRGVHLRATKSRRPSTTRRLASSVPMVMRKACGRP